MSKKNISWDLIAFHANSDHVFETLQNNEIKIFLRDGRIPVTYSYFLRFDKNRIYNCQFIKFEHQKTIKTNLGTFLSFTILSHFHKHHFTSSSREYICLQEIKSSMEILFHIIHRVVMVYFRNEILSPSYHSSHTLS